MTGDTDTECHARIARTCLGFPEAEEVGMWGGRLFRVRRRRFALFVARVPGPRALHVVTDPAEREALRRDARFRTSQHHPDRGWMALGLDPAHVDWQEVDELVESAYRHVAGRALVAELDRHRNVP